MTILAGKAKWIVGLVVLCAALAIAIGLMTSFTAEKAHAKHKGPTTTAFVHTSTSDNSQTNVTYIDNPATNGKPDAKLVVTHVYDAVNRKYDHTLGVFYNPSDSGLGAQQWCIYNEDATDMPAGLTFDVIAVS
jgi:hypothetical protein